MQVLEFGEQKPGINRKGQESSWGDWSFHVNCLWRIEGPDGFGLSDDHFGPVRCDEHAMWFYPTLDDGPVVESLSVLADGALRIRLSRGFSIAIDPRPFDNDHLEEWRFLPPKGDPRGHLVLNLGELGWSSEAQV